MRQLLLLVSLALAGCARPAPARPVSVLLVTIDTLRADRVGAYGDAAARTPQLDALAREGVLFERAFSPVPLTLPAHATILTGLLPPAARRARQRRLRARAPPPATLAETLKLRGLATAAFVGAFPLARRFGLARGFDVYDDAIERAAGPALRLRGAPRRPRRGRGARAGSRRRPARSSSGCTSTTRTRPTIRRPRFRGADPYRGEIAFADAELGRLLAAWDARPGPRSWAVASDHGEAFGEHGEESHGLFVYDTTLHVPLLLRGPGVAAGAARRHARRPRRSRRDARRPRGGPSFAREAAWRASGGASART